MGQGGLEVLVGRAMNRRCEDDVPLLRSVMDDDLGSVGLEGVAHGIENRLVSSYRRCLDCSVAKMDSQQSEPRKT